MSRCKRHTVDLSSSIGVCASCLRERLFSLAVSTAASENDDHPPPPPLIFPRSVSPYVAPRKSNANANADSSRNNQNRFFSTPQVGPTMDHHHQSYGGERVLESGHSFDNTTKTKKKRTGLTRFSSFFRTRSDDFESKFSSRGDYGNFSFTSPSSSSSSSRSWLSKILSKKQSKTCYIEDLIDSESDRPRHRFCRGMSPAGDTTMSEESPGRLRRTPTVIGTPGRRKTTTTIGLGKSVSGNMAFCLSPLVRAKPNSSSSSSKWKGKFLPPEFGYSGELKSPAKPHISTAASFCGNRSKKLVDLGRVDPRR